MQPDTYSAILKDLGRKKLPAVVKRVVTTVLDKKGEKTVVIKVRGISEITDFMVLCQGNSGRQNMAIADAIQENLKREYGTPPFNVEGRRGGDWILLDYIDFIVHVFDPETRDKFSLEKLWMDGKRYNFYPD